MGFFDTLKSVYNTVSDALIDPEYFKSQFEQRPSDYLAGIYMNTGTSNLDKIKREIIEEILDSRRSTVDWDCKFNLNQNYVFDRIYSKYSKEELTIEYQNLKSTFPRNEYSRKLRTTKLIVLEKKLGITKNNSVINKKTFNILKLLFSFNNIFNSYNTWYFIDLFYCLFNKKSF
ncbi:hypothetical protein OFQ54_10370 [Brachyspira hyodysenteriae]|uniref:hypothetical protein n=1 Tax=Brachyspira hyodysenteriae TaxID=159 RepID=UPI0022CD2F5C|nr:hypothetical protein [Brachyspira hyodysenteriae]MCZ9962221.1 hypothetical protein [Brachyspira hyodysenteriae]